MARQGHEVTLVLPVDRNVKCSPENVYIFESESLCPMEKWKKVVAKRTHVKLIHDDFLDAKVLEMMAPTAGLQATCYIQCPNTGLKFGEEADSTFLVFLIKNVNKILLVDIVDSLDTYYRIKVDTTINHPIVKSFSCIIPLKLEQGWYHLPFDMPDLASKIFNVVYKRTLKIRIHANCHLYKVYFTNEKPSIGKVCLK